MGSIGIQRTDVHSLTQESKGVIKGSNIRHKCNETTASDIVSKRDDSIRNIKFGHS